MRRRAGWALVAGLCVAAAAAIVALLVGSFGDTAASVVGTSLGFSVFSSTAAAGVALRLRPASWARALGAATAAASLASFVLLVAVLWIDVDDEGQTLLRALGIAGLAALWSSHASLLLRAARSTDSPLIRRLTATAIVSLGIDSAVGMLALVGALDDLDSEPFVRALAVLVVVALLSTILVPLLRRLARSARPAAQPAAAAAFGASGRRQAPSLAQEVAEVADRLAGMPLPVEARAEVARLRALARDASE